MRQVQLASSFWQKRFGIVNLQMVLSGNDDANLIVGARSATAQVAVRAFIPLWAGGQPQSRSRASLAEASAARFIAADFEERLVEEVTRAWAAHQGARSALSVASRRVEVADVARRGAAIEFDVGLRSTIEVLNQEEEWQIARIAEAEARADALSALAELAALIGVDPTGVFDAAPPTSPVRSMTEPHLTRAGRPAAWERPLMAVGAAASALEPAARDALRTGVRAIAGPEQ